MPEIFALEFMRRAFLVGLVVAAVAPTIGMFFVVRRYSAMADTLAHVSLAGDTAEAAVIPVRFLNRALAVLGASAIAIAMNVVGVLLIGALMVVPVLAAMQFRVGFTRTWILSLVVSVISVAAGLTLSFY